MQADLSQDHSNFVFFYFVSTALHLYCSSAIALNENKNGINILIFIDQKDTKKNIYYDAVTKWSTSPFNEICIFSGKNKGLLDKLRSRKKIFFKIKTLVKKYKPSNIFTGNDRRIEFQYAMHCANQYRKTTGNYLDEGIYSYLGRKESNRFSDMYIDNFIKKLTYGFWWKNPPTVGGSVWIDNVFAAFPDHIHSLLKNKTVNKLPADYFDNKAIKALSNEIIRNSGLNPQVIRDIDVFLTLPHESLVKGNDEYLREIHNIIGTVKNSGKTIAFKPHPRDETEWYALFKSSNVVELPQKANFEAIISLLENVTLLADLSSTLLIAKWLKPSLSIYAIKTSGQNSQFLSLFASVGIEVIDMQDLKETKGKTN